MVDTENKDHYFYRVLTQEMIKYETQLDLITPKMKNIKLVHRNILPESKKCSGLMTTSRRIYPRFVSRKWRDNF